VDEKIETSRIAVIGAGSIGVAWAIVFARSGRSVALYDIDENRLLVARTEIQDRVADLTLHELVEDGPRTCARITFSKMLEESLRDADYIQEAAPESLALKRSLFELLDAQANPKSVIASSSSAIPISDIAKDLPGRRRCLIVHPGNPPYLLRVAEVVPAPFTSPQSVRQTQALLAAVGMIPILVKREVEGFVFNRLQGALLREAYCLVRDGVASVADIDQIVSEGLGLRWSIIGPFETADLNTRGGIASHAERIGPAYARMGAERGQNDPWTNELVAKVVAERRALLPIEQWGERVAWRDRMLMAISRAKRLALGSSR
jgi:L-gulonate 3-dehydrogenase